MRHLGTLAPEVASLAAFNHAIVYVPKLDLFLDGTAEFHGSRELASADRVANVLIVEPEAPSRFLTTPESSADDNVTSLSLDVTLKVDGSAAAKGTLVAKGQGAPEMRRTYQTPATRVVTFEQQWAQSYPGVQASEVVVSDTKDLESPLTVKFGIAMPRYAEAGAGMLKFFPFGASRAFTQALAPLSDRKMDLVFPGVWANELEMNYSLPANWNVAELPPEVLEESPFGSLRINVTKKDGKLKVSSRLAMTRARITAKEYPEFRSWLLKVDQAFSRKIVAQQGGQTAAR
jgi:cellulose synthase operon protein C